MKRFLLLCMLLAGSCAFLPAQRNETHSPYFFSEFKDALVLYRNGTQYSAKVNFNLIKEIWLFIDTNDRNLKKEFSAPEDIAIIKIGIRTYVPSYGGLTEVLQGSPYVSVEYTAVTRKAPKSISYGGETQTAAVDTYSGMAGQGLISGRELDNRIVVGLDRKYEVKIGKKKKHFFDGKGFTRLFKKEKRGEVEQDIAARKTDFTEPAQVLDLFNSYFKR